MGLGLGSRVRVGVRVLGLGLGALKRRNCVDTLVPFSFSSKFDGGTYGSSGGDRISLRSLLITVVLTLCWEACPSVPVFCCAPAEPMPSSIATARVSSIFTWVPSRSPCWHRRPHSLHCNSAEPKNHRGKPHQRNARRSTSLFSRRRRRVNTRTYRSAPALSPSSIFTASAASSPTPTTPLPRAPQAAAMALRRHETCGARKRGATARRFQPVSLPLHGA